MRIIVLGSAAGGGFPQWNCNCANCRRARAGDPAAAARTQSSVAVSANDRDWLLLNAAPELRLQILATPALHPRQGVRDSPIAAVLPTNADVDHIGGLINLREGQPFALYGSDRVLGAIDGSPVFGVLNPDVVPRKPVVLNEPFPVQGADGRELGLTVEVFPVPGKVALYLENESAGPGFGTQEGDTVGVRLRDAATGAEAFYLPNCAAIDAPLAERLRGAALAFFDGTLYRDDEMVRAGLGQKTGTRMGHMNISGPEGSLAAFEELDVARKIYIHINNSNPILLADSPERREVEAAGWEVAHDGMEVVL